MKEADLAKRAKLKQQDEKPTERSGADIRRDVEEILRQKGLASEYQSSSGGLTRQFVKRYGLDQMAASVSIRLKTKDEQKRQAFIVDSLKLWRDLGYFDQMDAFSDPVAALEEIVSELKARIPNAPRGGDDVIEEMLH